MVKMEYVFDRAIAAFTLAVVCLMTFMCLNPFKWLFFRTDLVLMRWTFWEILISPFGQVQFRHFFTADIFTSMGQALKDIGYVGCYFTYGQWLNSTEPTTKECPRLENYLLVITFIPLWFRFAQCFKKYYDDPKRDKKTFANAGKYFTSIMVQVAGVLRSKVKGTPSYNFFIIMSAISTTYSYSWDIYMDWGLLRSSERGKFMLRPEIRLPSWFYYFAAFTNLIMRLLWILPLFQAEMPAWVASGQVLTTCIAIAEILRRAQWSILRLENEQVNNLENYRTQLDMEDLLDDDDLEKNDENQ
jgi:hypothetical protein